MKTVWNWIQVVLAAIGGGLGWFFGEMDGFFYALIAFVVIDYSHAGRQKGVAGQGGGE